jgi:lysozyme
MTAIDLATRLIRVFEGIRLAAYQDSGGIWTIGFGHTKGVKSGDVCDLVQAQTWLTEDFQPLLKQVEGLKPLVAAAYLSFGYNCGAGALRRVLGGESKLEDFNHDRKGKVLAGLVARRALEAALIEFGGEV